MAKKKSKKSKRPLLGGKWRVGAYTSRGGLHVHFDERRNYQLTGYENLSTKAQCESAASIAMFDELVVDDWLHIERMNTNAWWMRLGDANLWIEVDPVTQKIRMNTYDGIITPRGFLVEEKPEDDERKARA